ncbi:hypothetical protein HK104_009595 [Borealophlyctis nickersoniae]|nr:hypothetical protein HK104_009595 [Borealophlyctis nickersoniae]
MEEDLPLRLAVRNGHTKVVEFLLDNGADVHAKGEAALRLAAASGRLELVKCLLDNGADVNADGWGDIASTADAFDMQKQHIEEEDLFLDLPLRWAAENGHTRVVKLLLDKGADVHYRHDIALRYAAANGHVETVQCLLDNGADVNAYGMNQLLGSNALTMATGAVGADVHAQDNFALFWAACEGQSDVARLLLKFGADPLDEKESEMARTLGADRANGDVAIRRARAAQLHRWDR